MISFGTDYFHGSQYHVNQTRPFIPNISPYLPGTTIGKDLELNKIIDLCLCIECKMGKILDAKETKTIVSVPAEAKSTTVGPILILFTIINNYHLKFDIISFLLSTDQCSLRGIFW